MKHYLRVFLLGRFLINRTESSRSLLRQVNNLYAGLDWSGNPNRENLLIVSVAAMEDLEAWNGKCRVLREQLGMARDAEFHGRDIRKPENMLAFLSAGHDAGGKFGALVLDKNKAWQERVSEFTYASSALVLLSNFLPSCLLRTLWYDQEIQGRQAVQEFETAVRRLNRALYPETRLALRSRKSHTSDLIQLADVMAYVLRRMTLEALNYPPLEQFVKDMAADERNLIIRL